MDKIYLKDNYIVTEIGGIIAVFPKNYSGYSENASGFYINSTFPVNNQRTIFIAFSDVGSIYDEAGVTTYTTDTLRTFLLSYTGFKSPSGGSGGVWGSITGTLSSQTDLQSALDAKQDDLISGTNIKTINSTSLLGSGDLAVQPTLVSGTNIRTINGNSLLGSGDLTIGGGGITVGTTPVTSGTDTRVFFQQGGVVQQDANFTYNNTQKRLTLRASGATATDIPFVVRNSADTFDILSCYGDELTIIGRNQSNEPRLLINRAGSTRMLLGGTTDLNITFSSSGMGQINSGAQGLDIIASSGDIRTRNSSTFTVLKGNFFGIGAATPAARLDVRAQGALSTDIAFRVRNSADNDNIIQANGNNSVFLLGSDGGGLRFSRPTGHNILIQHRPVATLPSQLILNSFGQGGSVPQIIFDAQGAGTNISFNIHRYTFGLSTLTGSSIQSAFGATTSAGFFMRNSIGYDGAGTNPTTTPADHFIMYSADIVAGNAAPHFRTENGSIIKLFTGAALTASDGTLANAVTRIAELEARLQAHGLIA